MLYGANGFTARLIIDKLKALPSEIILSGRNQDTIEALAKEHHLESRVFALNHQPTVVKNLDGIGLVINCAGPFNMTALPLAKAALKSRSHYIDITGEIGVFQTLHLLDAEARSQGISIIPGVGFDIVPTDCLSKLLVQRAIEPRSLVLAVITKNTRPTHGTLKTALLHADQPTIVRRINGIVRSKPKEALHKIVLNNREVSCVRAPLPDLFCAHLSTGIEHIDTYLAMPKKLQALSILLPLIRKVSGKPLFQKIISGLIDRLPNGPSVEQQKHGSAYIVGEVSGRNRRVERGVLITPEPYVYTGDVLVAATKHWLENGLESGFHTPSQAFGATFAIDACPEGVKITFTSTHSSSSPPR